MRVMLDTNVLLSMPVFNSQSLENVINVALSGSKGRCVRWASSCCGPSLSKLEKSLTFESVASRTGYAGGATRGLLLGYKGIPNKPVVFGP